MAFHNIVYSYGKQRCGKLYPKPLVASRSREIFVFNLVTRPFLPGAIETVAVFEFLLNTIYGLSIQFIRLYCQ